MTSDINIIEATVTAIQGESISTESPTDGYALVWDGYEERWEPRAIASSSGLRKEVFTSDGYWTCPEGTTTIICFGAGGGGGASGGSSADNMASPPMPHGGPGGGGSIESLIQLSVTPGLTYSVIIAAGGTGGTGATTSPSGANGAAGTDGGTTYFKYMSTILISMIGGQRGSEGIYNSGGFGGTNCALDPVTTDGLYTGSFAAKGPGYGGSSSVNTGGASFNGSRSLNNFYNGGQAGIHHSTNYIGSGGGGGAGPQGEGAHGGAGETTNANGPNGANAVTNTGAGGGGGGAAVYGYNGGNGGNGGSGYLYIVY